VHEHCGAQAEVELSKVEESLQASGVEVAQPRPERVLPIGAMRAEEREIQQLEAQLERARKSKLIEQVGRGAPSLLCACAGRHTETCSVDWVCRSSTGASSRLRLRESSKKRASARISASSSSSLSSTSFRRRCTRKSWSADRSCKHKPQPHRPAHCARLCPSTATQACAHGFGFAEHVGCCLCGRLPWSNALGACGRTLAAFRRRLQELEMERERTREAKHQIELENERRIRVRSCSRTGLRAFVLA
jgi:hypothetical protein